MCFLHSNHFFFVSLGEHGTMIVPRIDYRPHGAPAVNAHHTAGRARTHTLAMTLLDSWRSTRPTSLCMKFISSRRASSASSHGGAAVATDWKTKYRAIPKKIRRSKRWSHAPIDVVYQQRLQSLGLPIDDRHGHDLKRHMAGLEGYNLFGGSGHAPHPRRLSRPSME